MDYVLFGIQGSGKGTQGKILAEKIKAVYFETGGELRRLSSEDSPLGKKVKAIIDAGRLVPNEVVMEIVENFVAKDESSGAPIIFDGIPRNKEQSRTFEDLLGKLQRDYKGIYFELSREEAERRLISRRICAKCKTVFPASYKGGKCEKCVGELVTRFDDNISSIRTRLDIFYAETLPVINGWLASGKMLSIDASGTIEEITTDLMSKIEGSKI